MSTQDEDEHLLFSEDQVRSINEFQESGFMHPFTCGNEECRQTLQATREGLVCPNPGCDYRQDWVHSFMADWSWKKGVWG